MPDLPLDTLFIVGLLIASFVGKFFQKKTGDESPSNKKPIDSSENREKTPTLRDVLREAWDKANQPEVLEPEFTESTPPPVSFEYDEGDINENEEIPSEKIIPEALPQMGKKLQLGFSTANNRIQGRHNWIKKELLSNRNSLKRAFLLKEILDKPKSLRPF
jgi:hypothetical protein